MKKNLQLLFLLLLGASLKLVLAQDEECGIPQLLAWSNLTVSEGGTAIYRCPLDTTTSCLVDSVEWFQVNPDGSRKLLKDSRVEVFAFDPLLMYMTDINRGDQGWYSCAVTNPSGQTEAKVYLDVLEVPGFAIPTSNAGSEQSDQEEQVVPEPIPEPVPAPAPETVPAPEIKPTRHEAIQMASNSVLTPVSETPPQTTTTSTTTPRSNKWARFEIYSKYRGSRVSYPGAGFGAAFSQALAADNITLIPRREEDMLKTTTSTTTRRPYWLDTTTARPPPPPRAPPPPPPPPRPTTPPPTPEAYAPSTEEPFSLYYDMNRNYNNAGPENQQPGSGNGKSNDVWARGGKVTIPNEVAAHLTHRDHLEAIHEHLRFIYDRLDDLLDRVHYLETKDRNN